MNIGTTFHIGISSKKKKIQKKKKTNKIVKESRTNYKYFFKGFNQHIFNIFPQGYFHPRIEGALFTTFANTKSIYSFVESWKSPPFNTSPSEWKNGLEGFWSSELVEGIEDAVFLILKHRFSFKKLLHHWKYKKLEKGNTHDLFTDELPKKPVDIVDWKLKKVWSFEASSLLRDITSRLYHHDGFFEDPQVPRNPYTNSSLTASQMISVWNQISSSGVQVSTPFTTFRAARWNLKRFIAEQSIALQLFAFRKTMRDLSHYDSKERLLDFIQTAYNNEAIDFYTQAYLHAINKYSDNEIIQRWRYLCLRFYEAEIAFYNNLDKKEQIQNKIWDETVQLLDKQKLFVSLRIQDLRNSVRVRGDTPILEPIPRLLRAGELSGLPPLFLFSFQL